MAAAGQFSPDRYLQVRTAESVLPLRHGDQVDVQRAGRARHADVARTAHQQDILRAGDQGPQGQEHGLLASDGNDD